MSCMTVRADLTGLAIGLAAGLALLSTAAGAETLPRSSLMATDSSGVPDGMTSEQWTSAQGAARVIKREDGHDVIELEAHGLVPEGVYTIWWVNSGLFGTSMGPGGGIPENEFTAEASGEAAATIRVASDNDYETMVVAYHADGQTHGDSPGEMGTQTFSHLTGPWPGPAGEPADEQ